MEASTSMLECVLNLAQRHCTVRGSESRCGATVDGERGRCARREIRPFDTYATGNRRSWGGCAMRLFKIEVECRCNDLFQFLNGSQSQPGIPPSPYHPLIETDVSRLATKVSFPMTNLHGSWASPNILSSFAFEESPAPFPKDTPDMPSQCSPSLPLSALPTKRSDNHHNKQWPAIPP